MSSPSMKPVKVDRGEGAAQAGARLADGIVSLQILRADIEQADRRLDQPEDRAGEDIAHQRELNEVLVVAFDIGAEIQHHALAAPGRKKRRNCRAVDPRQHLEHEFGDRHQRAGIAGRNHPSARPSATASIASRMLDCRPVRRPATACIVGALPRRCGATSRRRRDGAPSPAAGGLLLPRRTAGSDVGMPLQARYRLPYDHARSMVAAHCIKGDRDAAAHLARLCASPFFRLSSADLGHLPAVVVAAGPAQVVRTLQFAAIRAFGISGRFQGVMRAPHVAARRRSLLFWNGHWELEYWGVGCARAG